MMPADSEPLTALVPVKRLSEGKSRLSAVLSRPECRALVRAMLTDVLAALAQSRLVREIAVVTPDEAALAGVAHYFGVRLLCDAGGGLNPALERASSFLAGQGARRLLVLPVDVPLVTTADILRLAGVQADGADGAGGAAGDTDGPRSIVLAPSADRRGTNALLVAPPEGLDGFVFGPDSFRGHWRRALERGLHARAALLPNLALDIDTPEDLQRFLAGRSATASRAYLEGSGIAERLLAGAGRGKVEADHGPG